MTEKAREIAALLGPTVESLGLELLGAEYISAPGGAVLRLYIDIPADGGHAAGRALRDARTPLADADDTTIDDGSIDDATIGDATIDDGSIVDGAGLRGVVIEDCEAVSREVSAQLDLADPITSHYTLEVSSPGLDRPLFTPGQFQRFAGETAKVTLSLPQDGRRRVQGQIVRTDAGSVTLLVDGAEWTVAAANIEKARLVPDWAALGFTPAKTLPDGDGRPGKPGRTKDAARRTKQPTKRPNKPAAPKPPRPE